MRDLPDHLFYRNDLRATLQGNLKQAKLAVDNLPERDFLHSSEEEVVEHVFSTFEAFPLELHADQVQMDTHESEIDVRHDFARAVFDKSRPCMVPATKVVVSVPFSGDAALWNCKPSTYTLNPPRANVRTGRGADEHGEIEIVMVEPTDSVGDGSKFNTELDSTLSSIRGYLGNIRKEVEAHNRELREHIQKSVASRKSRLQTKDSVVKALNIPLKQRSGTPNVQALPIRKRIVQPLSSAPNEPPVPGIRSEDYENILTIIRHEGRSFETAPGTFAIHDENELRDIILAHLNGHYKGGATGETFRKHGKTDIRIEDQKRAAFVGECKVWHGEKQLSEAVNQLLGYLTWRDCKAALILFNKEVAGFTAIQTKVPEALKNHSNFVSQSKVNLEGEWRFVFRSVDDEGQKIMIHVFLFNLYYSATKSGAGQE